MRYSTAAMFRTAIEERMNLTFSNMAWSCLRDYLYTCALHEPFSDADIELAVKLIKKHKLDIGAEPGAEAKMVVLNEFLGDAPGKQRHSHPYPPEGNFDGGWDNITRCLEEYSS